MQERIALPELRVLVIDDDVAAATALHDRLMVLGCKAAVAFGGDMGLRIARLFQPDMVIVDLAMPGMDGCEVLMCARVLSGSPSRAFYVCLAGQDDTDAGTRCDAAGVDRLVSKPLGAALLAELVEQGRAHLAAWLRQR